MYFGLAVHMQSGLAWRSHDRFSGRGAVDFEPLWHQAEAAGPTTLHAHRGDGQIVGK
jgi:hypothetical protein